jgi:hypothetical protein
VISDGIDSLGASIQTGDLTQVFHFDDVRCRQGSGDEGTAMLEIVHDLAPGAQLFFSTGSGGKLTFIDSVNCLAAGGVRVLVDDVGFFDEPFFEDGPVAQTVRAAVASGVSYHSSAGNDAGKSVIQDYRPGPSGFLHDFGGGDEYNDMVVPPGGKVRCFLQWNDRFGQSGNDYDLFLIERSTGTVVASSTNLQNGLQDPKENVSFVNPLTSPLLIGAAIAKTATAQARQLKLYCPDSGTGLQYRSAQGDIFGHPALPEVVAVAAIGIQDPALSVVEAFSSRGPALIFFPSVEVRPKPDLAAFDGVVTTLPGGGPLNPFFGTSAAAPHSAAIAALLLSKNRGMTPAQIQTALTSSAVDVGPAGFDAASGVGRIDAFGAINAVAVPTTTTLPRCTVGGCDDANPCTDDACDPATGCQHVPNTASCSDGVACTVGDNCVGGQCQPGVQATAGTVSTLITASVNASVNACRTDKRKVVKKVVNPLVQAAKAFSRAEVAGVGTKKWTKKVSAGEKSIGNARSKLTKVQAKLSPPCVADLNQAITAGALADGCLR